MAKLILPAASNALLSANTPKFGELIYNEDTTKLVFGDGKTVGGVEVSAESFKTLYVYGVDIDTTVGLPAATLCKRVELNVLHDTKGDPARYTYVTEFSKMPCHNLRRCVVSDMSSKSVAYYLDANDSNFKEDGSPADLTGGDGDVMVEMPVAHWRVDTYTDSNSHIHRVYLISTDAFAGSSIHPCFYVGLNGDTPKTQYVSAFRASLFDAEGNYLPQTTDEEIAAPTPGSVLRSVAGVKPVWRIPYMDVLECADTSSCFLYSYITSRYIALLMTIELNTTNSYTLTTGYSRLINDSVPLRAAIRNTGRTAVFGNGSGEVLADDAGEDADLLTMSSTGGTLWKDNGKHVVQMSYRGIEDVYGSNACACYGFAVYRAAAYSTLLYTTAASLYKELLTETSTPATTITFDPKPTGKTIKRFNSELPTVTGFISEMDKFMIVPTSVAGGRTDTNYCDAYYNSNIEHLYSLRLGGGKSNLSDVGMNMMALNYVESLSRYVSNETYRFSC